MVVLSVPPITIYKPKIPTLMNSSVRHPPSNYYDSPTCLFVSNSHQLSELPTCVFPPLNQSVAAIVFGDGPESKLYPLTKRRSDGAIPIAANYRLVDVVVSNCINSNVTKIYAFTQFNSTSLNSHLSRAYSALGLGRDGFVEVIAAYQSPEEDSGWFQGSADAVRRCLWVLEEHPVIDFLVLPGHHLYKMDYQNLINVHRSSGADITVAASSSTMNRNPGFGYLHVNSDKNYHKVLEFRDKPEWDPQNLSVENSSDHQGKDIGGGHGFWSMGIYAIKRDALVQLLKWHFPKANDIATEVIPGALTVGTKVHSYIFDGYWEDMRNIEAFYQANMDIRNRTIPGFNFYDKDSPVYTQPRCMPPTLIADAVITESIIGDGCILNNCKIKNSVIGMRSCIRARVVIEDSVVMGADIYQMEDVAQRNAMSTKSVEIPIGIGEGSYIKKAIIDKNARIGQNARIMNKDNVQEGNSEDCGYVISAGIVTVLRSAVIPNDTII